MEVENTIVIFTYGSNMLAARLQARVPSAKLMGIGRLLGYQLKWHKRSRDHSGKCDAQYTGNDADFVWGVLFRIDATEKHQLDVAEGLNNGYEEKQISVFTDDGTVAAQVYYATEIDATVRPYSWYKAFVVAGALENLLPDEYVAALEAVESIPDFDVERVRDNATILNSSPACPHS